MVLLRIDAQGASDAHIERVRGDVRKQLGGNPHLAQRMLRTRPLSILPGRLIRRRMAMIVVVLPQPLSPIKPKRSLRLIVKLMSSTAFTGPRPVQ